jgi:hypothetical protein
MRVGSGDVVLGMLVDPGVIETRVIGNEIEHQANAACPQSATQASQCPVAAESFVCGVAGDGKSGPGDVLFSEIGQRVLELATPLGVAA